MTPESVVQIFVWSKRRSGDTNGSSRFSLIPSLADQCCDPLSCQTALSSLAGRCGQIAAQTRVASARAPRGRRQEVSPPLKFPGLVVFSEGRHPRAHGTAGLKISGPECSCVTVTCLPGRLMNCGDLLR